MATVHCPKCDSEELRLKHIALANLLVIDWTIENGRIDSLDCESNSDPEWEASDVERQFICDGCEAELRSDDLVVREGAADGAS